MLGSVISTAENYARSSANVGVIIVHGSRELWSFVRIQLAFIEQRIVFLQKSNSHCIVKCFRSFTAVCSLCIHSVCNFGCFRFWFRGQDFGSDCTSFWSLLNFTFPKIICCRKCDLSKTVAKHRHTQNRPRASYTLQSQ